MKHKPVITAHIIGWLLLCVVCLNVKAQKLPNKQEQSVRAPKNVKIDGKTNEWGQLQAYNSSTQVYYTLANDDQHLYLIIKTQENDAVRKILVGGITFRLNNTDKLNGAESQSVTFPVLAAPDVSSIAIKYNEPISGQDSIKARYQLDSLVRLLNMDVGSKLKDIKLHNIIALADTSISVYNDDDIKAVVRFDEKRNLVYELSIPLRYIRLSAGTASRVSYKIILNGLATTAVIHHANGVIVFSAPHGLITQTSRSGLSMTYPTDVSGEYVLK